MKPQGQRLIFSAPANNARYLNPATITVSATASPPEANETVTKVDFYANGVWCRGHACI